MSFWNEAFYFEKSGDRYVYRPTVFSPGFDISEAEKNQLFKGFLHLQLRTLLEAGIAIGVIGVFFMTGVIKTQTPIPLFMISSILAVIVLAVTILFRRDKLVRQVLGPREPDVPRPPLKKALTRTRPVIGKRYAIPILKSVVYLFGFGMLAGDGLITYVVVRGYDAHRIAETPEEIAAVEKFFSLTVDNLEFWAGVGVFNLFSVLCIALLIHQLRCLRAIPDS